MKAYLESILTVLLVSALAPLLMPEGEGKKFVRFALSLLVLFTVISPFRTGELVNFLASYQGGAFDYETSVGEGFLLEYEKRAIEEGIAAALAEKYGVDASLISLDTECEEGEGEGGRTVRVKSLSLHLYGRACTLDVPAIVRQLEGELSADCEVIYHR